MIRLALPSGFQLLARPARVFLTIRRDDLRPYEPTDSGGFFGIRSAPVLCDEIRIERLTARGLNRFRLGPQRLTGGRLLACRCKGYDVPGICSHESHFESL